jgi:hypothetical protein
MLLHTSVSSEGTGNSSPDPKFPIRSIKVSYRNTVLIVREELLYFNVVVWLLEGGMKVTED